MFLIVFGVVSITLGLATWHWGKVLQNVRTPGGIAVHGLAAILGGIATCAALLRYLLPALRRSNPSSARDHHKTTLCIATLAVFSALFGLTDFNLVTMYGELRPKESLQFKSWLQSQNFSLTVSVLGLWLVIVTLYIYISYKVILFIRSSVHNLSVCLLIIAAVGHFIGIFGYCAARIAGPMLTGLWDGRKPSTINLMTQAVAELGMYLKYDGAILVVSGTITALVGIRLPREYQANECRSCGYPVEGVRCPECGTSRKD